MTQSAKPERMRAGYLLAPGEIVVRDELVPSAEAGGVVVRVRAALTDGTDLKAFRRGHPQMPMPTRFGHEFSGDVVALGDGVTGFSVGDAIMCVHSAPCAACPWCRDGEEHLCEHVMETKILGAYADYIAVPPHILARNAFLKPANLSYEAAAFLEPLACVVHSFDLLALRPCSRVVVIGDGGFGILHALAARALLGDEAILIGRRRERLVLAAELGLEHVVDARDFDERELIEFVRSATGGRGADAVIECTGTKAVWESAPAYARRGGSVALFGGLPAGTRVEFDAARLHYDEIRLLSPFHFSPAAVRRAYGLLVRGEVDVVPLITARFELDRLAEAFAALDAGDGVKY
ncbi:MAG: alcohol dehydrogenase catalytic domain-containing protein, partial [Candidatus Baltobacteraceae bacterium]